MSAELRGLGDDALLQATERHAHARALLTSALKSGDASHAYLFHGPRGVGKADAARAFAAALLAEGARDQESSFGRAMRGSHPDLTWVTPSGAHEMLLADIETPVVRGATRTPMEGARRVFVIDRIETMSDAVANSMLKTLEEPAQYVHFVLMTAQPERVLPTISSRCQTVRFDAIPASAIAAILESEGIEADRAASCAALSSGDVALARELAGEDGDAMRSEAGRIVGCALRGVSGRERPWEGVLSRAQEAGELEEQRTLARLEADLEAFPSGREKTAAHKVGEQAAHRIARRVRSDSLDRSLRICALLLRDIAAAAGGAPDLVLAQDRATSIVKSADGRALAPLIDAAHAVEATRRQLGRNVAEELTLQALSFRLDRLLAGV
ncbi:MAG: AAA family ATPase [Solirubrobacterales bacterium]|nr:AAA family ATPase [Solirubrobacterales bacterium]